MNRTNAVSTLKQRLFAVLLCCSLPGWSWAAITNTASATFKDAAGGSYPGVTSNTVSVNIIVAPVIALVKTASPLTAKAGDTVTFTIQYSNTGGDATNVVITDAIPTGSTFKTGSIVGPGTLSAGTITWTLPSVTAGTSGTVSFQVTVN